MNIDLRIHIPEYFFLSADLAGIIIALQCLSFLALPITSVKGAAVFTNSTLVIWSTIYKQSFRGCFAFAFSGTIFPTTSKSDLIYVCCKWIFANFAQPLYFHCFRFSQIWLWLTCSVFTCARQRTKATWAAWPRFKFFMTPLTNTLLEVSLAWKYSSGRSFLQFVQLQILERARHLENGVCQQVIILLKPIFKNYNIFVKTGEEYR